MNEENGINIEAYEMIEGLTNRITQLTLDSVAKDILIRKLQSQLQSQDGGESKGDQG